MRATEGSFDDPAPKATLRVGVSALDHTKESNAAALEVGGVSLHPEAIMASPDGNYLAILAHGYMSEYSDQFELKILPAAGLRDLVK